MVGIGGVSMSPLAEILHNSGISVSGSDVSESASISALRSVGIKITIGHAPENLSGADFVIRTAAARDDNIEIKTARDLKIPVFERSEAWGLIMRGYKDAVCVAGVHGKSTTTSMVSHILLAAEKDPTIMIGGTLPVISSGCRVGKGDVIVLESCEYYNSFHNFSPTTAIILNIDADHLDFFESIEQLKDSFLKFASLVPEDGFVICNFDDKNTMETLGKLNRPLVTYGFDKGAKVRGVNVDSKGKNPSMDIAYNDEIVGSALLQIPGLHNLSNSLAAAAACLSIGVSFDAIRDGLYSFTGVERRFEFKGSVGGADVYDDYAHHPSELSALLDLVEALGEYKRTIVAFQPHTYTRTKALFDDFSKVLKRPDIVFLADIYSARETSCGTISSADLADTVPGAEYIPDFEKMSKKLSQIARPGDIILTVGAGDIYKVGESLISTE